jgi:hypothetical protein
MKRFLAIPAYIWAVICMLLIPATFMGNYFFAQKLSTAPFMKVNPVYTGGDSIRSYLQDSMTITINKPVFESLIGTSRKGFVQVKFSGELPDVIESTIDYDNNGKSDFGLNINTKTGDTKLDAMSNYVSALDVSSKVKDYWIVRVKIMNIDKN